MRCASPSASPAASRIARWRRAAHLRRADAALDNARRDHREGSSPATLHATPEPAVTLDPPVILDPAGIVLEPKAV